jgi:hypothetical protein
VLITYLYGVCVCTIKQSINYTTIVQSIVVQTCVQIMDKIYDVCIVGSCVQDLIRCILDLFTLFCMHRLTIVAMRRAFHVPASRCVAVDLHAVVVARARIRPCNRRDWARVSRLLDVSVVARTCSVLPPF